MGYRETDPDILRREREWNSALGTTPFVVDKATAERIEKNLREASCFPPTERRVSEEEFRREVAEEAALELLKFIDPDDWDREGLHDTPKRIVKALHEMTEGYRQDPYAILSTQFAEGHDELVIVRGVEFHSLCEHHLLPFTGVASVAYLPGPSRKVVGLSKLARVVLCFAKRLQVQERMTREIAEAVALALDARGVGVVVRAHHLCMGCRGVRQPHAEMVTSCLLGTLRDNADARREFLALEVGG